MRLVSFSTTDLPHPRLGLVQQDEIVDVDLAARALNLQSYDHMQDLIDHYEQGMAVLQAISDKAAGRRLREVKTFSAIGAAYELSQVELAAPIPRPRKNVMCLGLNYAEHAKESDRARGAGDCAGGAHLFHEGSHDYQ
jgi:2-keto-4-pentenoate hydratase/2-oxohepta-3-ene-1,7-dioic acid hydratase in catechol pathway